MKALIFGAAGQLGTALRNSAPNGAEVVSVTRAECDLADLDAIKGVIETHKPTHILNAAAYTAVDAAESDEQTAAAINAEAPRAMAQAAKACGAQLIHVSTDFVFDGMKSSPYRPDDQANPLGVYGQTKRDGELAVMEANPSALIVRAGWIYGTAGDNFAKTMLRLGAERDALSVVADQVGTPTAARSLANALWRLTSSDTSGIHHYSDSGVASWYDFAVAIFEEAVAAGLLDHAPAVSPIPATEYPTPAERPKFSVLDTSDTDQRLGSPPLHWRVNLRQVIKELKDLG